MGTVISRHRRKFPTLIAAAAHVSSIHVSCKCCTLAQVASFGNSALRSILGPSLAMLAARNSRARAVEKLQRTLHTTGMVSLASDATDGVILPPSVAAPTGQQAGLANEHTGVLQESPVSVWSLLGPPSTREMTLLVAPLWTGMCHPVRLLREFSWLVPFLLCTSCLWLEKAIAT